MEIEKYKKMVEDIGYILSEDMGVNYFLTVAMTDKGPQLIGTAMQNSLFLIDCAHELIGFASNAMKKKIVENE